MSGLSISRVENPSDCLIEAATKLLIRAFDHDLPLRSMTGGNPSFEAPLFRAMIRAGALEGSLYIVQEVKETAEPVDSDHICALAICFGPGKKLYASDAQRELGWNAFFESLPSETQNWWTGEFHTKHAAVVDRLLGEKHLDGWYVDLLATDPDYQCRGYASALLQDICAKAVEERKIVALTTEAPANVRFYERFGFRVINKSDIRATTGDWSQYLLVCGDV